MTDQHQQVVVYLLHDASGRSPVKHYVGSTTAAQWARRMADHRAGNGGATTRRMVRAGADLRCARLWFCDDRSTERRIKQSGHYSKGCPICRGELPLDHVPPIGADATALVEDDPLFRLSMS